MAAPAFESIGPYQNPEFVAEGGMAWVFRVQDRTFQTRRLALKLLKPDAARGEELRLFEREAELLAGISHPNLVTIFDYGRDEATGFFYYTMSFVEGPTLSELIRRQADNRLPPPQAVNLVCGMLEGLEQLHDRGIVHRDIKPGNLLVAPGERPVLMDLGIARVLPQSDLTQYTSTQVIRGTPLYMSPEQSEGKAARTTSDIFSVGLTLYCMLTGHTVYDDASNVDSTNPHSVRDYLGHLRFANGDFELILPRDIPRDLRQVVHKACRINPDERFQNAREMVEALRAGGAVGAVGGGGLPRWAVAAGAAVILAALGLGAYQLFVVPRQAHQKLAAATASAEAAAERAPALIEQVKDLSPAPPEELLEGADELLNKAEGYLVDAQDDALMGEEDGSLISVATVNFGKAETHYAGACGKLAPDVTSRVDEQSKRLDVRVATLREADAPTHVPDDWPAFETRLAGFAPPEAGTPPCELLAAELERLDGTRGLLGEARDIEESMGERLNRLAEEACSEARSAQTLARGESAEAPTYAAALQAGEALLDQAENFMYRASYPAARKACQEASNRFSAAGLVVTAWKARQESRRVESEITAQGIVPAPDGIAKIGEADASYLAENYEAAAEQYAASIALLRTGLADSAAESQAKLAVSTAQAARETAVAAGADKSAPGPLQRGDSSRDKAMEALRSGGFDEAKQAAGLAEQSYAEARSAASAALGLAAERESEAQMKLAGQPCDKLESSAAKTDCQTALSSLEAGRALLRDKDAPGAVGSFKQAVVALGRATAVENKYQGDKQWEPELVSRKPKREVVEERRNRTLSLEIEARDRNQDELSYLWTFDGQPLETTGPRLQLLAARSGTASVRVSDGRGGTLTESWEIRVKSTPPTLTVTPTAKSISIDPGETAQLRVEASDPDGDPVSTAFRLDGREVAAGESYAFSSNKPGTYKIEVVGTNPAGAETVVARTIVVRRPAAPVTPPTATTPTPTATAPPAPLANRPPKLSVSPSKSSLALELGETQTFRATVSDPDQDAVTTTFLLDGKQVATGSSYQFSASAAGKNEIEVVARDAKGNETRAKRTVQVNAPATVAGWRRALQRYEAALEAKNMKALQSVWLLRQGDRYQKRWERRFNGPDAIKIDIKIRKVNEKGDRVEVLFDQTETHGTKNPRTYTYQAVLLKRATTDDWQIIEAGVRG